MELDHSGENVGLSLMETLKALGADEKQAEKIVRAVDFAQARCQKNPWSSQMREQMALLGAFASQKIPDFRTKTVGEINDELAERLKVKNILEKPIHEYSVLFQKGKPQSANAMKNAFCNMLQALQGKMNMNDLGGYLAENHHGLSPQAGPTTPRLNPPRTISKGGFRF